MSEHQIEELTHRLAATLAEERRKAVAYTLLTVLCTPVFVALASVVLLSIVLYVAHESDYRIDNASAIYLGLTLFLASAVGLTAGDASKSTSHFGVDRAWLAGAGAFLVLLALTYGTSLRDDAPAFFGVVYLLLCLLILGLVGRFWGERPVETTFGEPPTFLAFILVVCGFIASSYAELFSASWLWVPPKLHEVRIAARVLCRLAETAKGPLNESVVEDRIERLLIRLKLVGRTGSELYLTPRGWSFFRAVTDGCRDTFQAGESSATAKP